MALRARKPIPTIQAHAAAGRESAPADTNLGLLVGRNLHRLRARRGWSLDAVARLSGVSRAMLGQIENARSVPTINVVWKIACAFEVPFSAMIADQGVERLRVLPAGETKILASASGDFTTRALFPFDGERRSEFYEIRMKPGGVEAALPHAAGTVENLVVVEGALEIEVAGDRRTLGAGDAIQFQADAPHTYRNPGNCDLLAYLVMTYAEPAG